MTLCMAVLLPDTSSKALSFLYYLQGNHSGLQIETTAQEAFRISKNDTICLSEAYNLVKAESCFSQSPLFVGASIVTDFQYTIFCFLSKGTDSSFPPC